MSSSYVCVDMGMCVQAMIAESIGHNETMDLFRHATELAYHVS